MTSLSIIIILFKPGDEFKKCFSQLTELTTDFEIIIYDNEGWNIKNQKLVKINNKTIRHIYSSKNFGFAKACNEASKYCRGDLLLFLNPDTLISDRSLQGLIVEHGKREDAWIICPKLCNLDGSEQSGSRRNHITLACLFIEYTKLFKIFNLANKMRYLLHNTQQSDQEIECGSGAAFLMSKKHFKRLGGFDESFFLHFEDCDLFLRHSQIGGKSIFKASLPVFHYKSTSKVVKFVIVKYKIISFTKYLFKHNFKIWNLFLLLLTIVFMAFVLCLKEIINLFK